MNHSRAYNAHSLAPQPEIGRMNAVRIQQAIAFNNLDLPETLKNPAPGNGSRNAHVKQLLEGLPKHDHMADAAELIEKGEDPDPALALHAGQELRAAAAYLMAEKKEYAWVEQFDTNADTIIEAFRTQMFEPLIRKVVANVEKYGDKLDLDQAVEARDFERAADLAAMTDGFGSLLVLHEVREKLHGGQVTGTAAWLIEPNEMSDPAVVAVNSSEAPDVTKAHWWARMIRTGYTPHFPTLGEYLDLLNSEAHREHREMIEARNNPTFAPGIRFTTEGGRDE